MTKDDSRQSAHLVGACGAGMKALAEVLLDLDWDLSGSDLLPASVAMQNLRKRGLSFSQGHDARHVPADVQRLIYSPAIPPENVERLEAVRLVKPQYTYSQMVGKLMDQSTGVCIAGTHGKSTTTAMVAAILDRARRLSAVVMGAEDCSNGRSGWVGEGDLFVAESCEFQQSFFDFHPKYAVLLSIEPDHFDCYHDLNSLASAFRQFAGQVADDGVLLRYDDSMTTREVSSTATTKARRVTFGSTSTADWTIDKYQASSTGCQFDVVCRGTRFVDLSLKLFGHHNAMNALAATALCAEIGVTAEVISESLSSFGGIRRRLEFIGEWNGATLIDDYAHHPTAVRATLSTIRTMFPDRPIRCIFQPHQLLRTTTLMDEFGSSFTDASEVLIAPIFAARETGGDHAVSVSKQLADRISSRGVRSCSFSSLDRIVDTLEDSIRPGQVIVTMGAGDIDRIHYEFTRHVQTDSSAG